MMGQDFRKAELTSVPITLILLVAVFGALIAAGIPVLLAGSAVMVAVSLLAVPSRWLPIGSSTSEVVLIIGMAVGVDYSLFYLRREREERAAGASFAAALATAAATSGRAIVVSGLTVMISLAGLLLTGIDFFTGIAVGTILVVGVAVVGSLTFLPALLACSARGRTAAGSRSWAGTGPRPGRPGCGPPWSAGWCAARWSGAARPRWRCWRSPLPALGMRIGSPAIDLPGRGCRWCAPWTRSRTRFPGGPAPAEVVVTGRRRDQSRHARRGGRLQARASARGAIRRPVTADVVGGRPRAGHLGAAGRQRHRDSVSRRGPAGPAEPGPARHDRDRARDVSYAVTGNTAGGYDFSAALRSSTPIVFGGGGGAGACCCSWWRSGRWPSRWCRSG